MCVEEKTEIKDSYLPCLKYKNELTAGETKNIKEFLCQVGTYQWCTRFCNMTDRQLELKFLKEYQSIIPFIESLWLQESENQ